MRAYQLTLFPDRCKRSAENPGPPEVAQISQLTPAERARRVAELRQVLSNAAPAFRSRIESGEGQS